jgi:hypothetical protein
MTSLKTSSWPPSILSSHLPVKALAAFQLPLYPSGLLFLPRRLFLLSPNRATTHLSLPLSRTSPTPNNSNISASTLSTQKRRILPSWLISSIRMLGKLDPGRPFSYTRHDSTTLASPMLVLLGTRRYPASLYTPLLQFLQTHKYISLMSYHTKRSTRGVSSFPHTDSYAHA